MKNHPKQSAKILYRSEGAGPPSPDTVWQRAQEIAQINGRKEHNEEDWKQAYFEVHGHPMGAADEEDNPMAFSGHDMVSYDSGHHVENIPQSDPENLSEELFHEGMDEAVHEQMLEASRGNLEEEEEESQGS